MSYFNYFNSKLRLFYFKSLVLVDKKVFGNIEIFIKETCALFSIVKIYVGC